VYGVSLDFCELEDNVFGDVDYSGNIFHFHTYSKKKPLVIIPRFVYNRGFLRHGIHKEARMRGTNL